jgi:hypothetical protein
MVSLAEKEVGMKPTTAGAARRGGTYLNTAGAPVTISEDQANVAPGYVRVLVNGQAFPVPDSLPLFEPDATPTPTKIDVAELIGKPEAAIAAALVDLTDDQLDELANDDGRSFVLRLVTEEQDRRAGLGVAPALAAATVDPSPPVADLPDPAPGDLTDDGDLPPLVDDDMDDGGEADRAAPPAASDLAEGDDAAVQAPALEPDGWEPRRVTCPCCGRAASTEWSVGRAGEVLGNHRERDDGHLCRAVGYPMDVASNMRPPTAAPVEGSATSAEPAAAGVPSSVDPIAADLGDETDPPKVEPPTAAELGGVPPRPARPVSGGDPWNGQTDQAGKIGLVKETSRLDDLDRLASAAGLARIMQEINRQRVALEEVERLAGVLVDESQPAPKRLAAAEEIERIASRERTQISRPGVARLAASYRDRIAALRAELSVLSVREQADLVRRARTDGPAVETLADYATALQVPPAVTYLHEVMPDGWPAPLVAVLVDLTGGVRACRGALRDLSIAEAATGVSATEIIEHALALELRGEARETVLVDLRSALARRTKDDPATATPTPTPTKKTDDEPDQAEFEAAGQLRLPPPVAVDERLDAGDLPIVDAEALALAREANPAGLRLLPRPDGADLYVLQRGSWRYVGPSDHPEITGLVERKAKLDERQPSTPTPTPTKRTDDEPDQAAPARRPGLWVEPNPGESAQDLADALSIGRGLLAMQRRGFAVSISTPTVTP